MRIRLPMKVRRKYVLDTYLRRTFAIGEGQSSSTTSWRAEASASTWAWV